MARRADGPKIRDLREAANLTVDEMVTKLKEHGIDRHPDHIRNIELGYSQPGLKLLHGFAAVLKKRYEDLLMQESEVRSA